MFTWHQMKKKLSCCNSMVELYYIYCWNYWMILKHIRRNRPSWSKSYGSWINNYMCNQCLSAQKLWVWIPPCGVCSIQHYMIKFLSDLQKICRFLRVLRISPQIKNYWHDITEILLKVALSIISSMELYGMTYIVLTSKTN